MKSNLWKTSLAALGALALLTVGNAAKAATIFWDFSWVDVNGQTDSASLTLYATPVSPGVDQIFAAHGTYDGYTVTGLNNWFWGPDNLAYVANAIAGGWLADGSGISFDYDVTGSANYANIYYTLVIDTYPGDFNEGMISQSVSVVPELSTWAMMFAGMAVLGSLGVRGRKAVANA
jgi:hypothetical protein